MVDETTDKANKEQVVLVFGLVDVFGWVDEDLVAHEVFIGLCYKASIISEVLLAVIKDTILRMNLKLEYYHGQCYNGASCMNGAEKGVAKTRLW